MEAFDCLPIACLINDKFFIVHGGISPELVDISTLNNINRFTESPKEGTLCDLLWSDPCDNDEEATEMGWTENTVRGCSFVFGDKASAPFLKKNNCLTIIRGHEAQQEGYKISKWNNVSAMPSVITIFSAPNYCDVYGNKGAILKIVNNKINIQQFNFQPHPFILPNFLNVFSWSIPFVSEKIGEMLIHIIKSDSSVNGEMDEGALIEQTITNSLKMKVKFLTLIMKMFRTLREENELIMKLKGFCPGNKIPKGILMEGPEAIKSELGRYQFAKELDKQNEKMPN
jgi:serine/threonine-protein phosphatase 2B catalytic subunit